MTTQIQFINNTDFFTTDEILLLKLIWEYTNDTRSYKKLSEIFWEFSSTTKNGFITDNLINYLNSLEEKLIYLNPKTDLTPYLKTLNDFIHYMIQWDYDEE